MNELKLPGWLLISGAIGILLVSIFFPGTIEQNVNSFSVMVIMAIIGIVCLHKGYQKTSQK